MSETVIKVENISKFYQLGLINHGTLAKDLQGWWAKIRGREDPNSRISMVSDKNTDSDTDFIYALKDVSFDVKQGEVLGIIGANGAGKSTLLKILSRVTSPTSGCIKIKGRIGSLLEVGTGFHPELTGRENIYLNGAILGMRKHEIDRKLDEIIDFSGVEKFIDTPVKRYSSGMYVRLAFAVAAHLDPEILVVDEVLAVGDADFQKKCLGKMDDVSKKEGRTVLFVSHNMNAVLNLCKTGVLLENGGVKLISSAKEVINVYTSSSIAGTSYINTSSTNKILISRIEYYNKKEATDHFTTEDSIIIRTTLQKHPNYKVLSATRYNIMFFRDTMKICFLECSLEKLNEGTGAIIDFELPKQFFTPGPIHIEAAVHIPNVEFIDRVCNVCKCEILDANTNALKYNYIDRGVVLANPLINIIVTP